MLIIAGAGSVLCVRPERQHGNGLRGCGRVVTCELPVHVPCHEGGRVKEVHSQLLTKQRVQLLMPGE